MHFKIKIKKQCHCLICFNDLFHDFSFQSINLNDMPICNTCFNQFEIANIHDTINNYSIWYLYYYNDFIKKLIYQYKGCYDIELAPVFLAYFLEKIKKEYKDYYIVYPPSSDKDNKERGFIHVKEIVKHINNNVYDIFIKKEHYKQSDVSYKDRVHIKDYIDIHDYQILENKKILLLDDIYTSGNTIKTCINLIVKNVVHFKDLKIICIAKTRKKNVEI